MKPIASVIIPNLNGLKWLDRCIRSLLAQTLQPIEIILVDNASTDKSVEFVRQTFPKVRILSMPENLGFAAPVNAGIRVSEGEFVVMFNNDAWAEPEWLQRLVEAMGKDPVIASAACKTLDYHDPNRIYSLGDGFLPSGDAFNIARGMFDRPGLPMPHYVFGPSGCTAIYRRTALDKVGFLDEDFFAFHEDVDLNFRLQLAGYKCIYVPDAVAYHVGYATARAFKSKYAFMSGRNRWWVLYKNLPLSLWMRYAPQLAYGAARQLWWGVKGDKESLVRWLGSLSSLVSLLRQSLKRRRELRRMRSQDVDLMLRMHEELRREMLRISGNDPAQQRTDS